MSKAFKGTPTRGANLGIDKRVDKEAGVIYGVSAIEAYVEALGHGLMADTKSLAMLAELGNEKASVKSRFGHPSMSQNALGKQVAQAKNFRVSSDGKKLLTDMYMLESARISPVFSQDPIEYIYSMALNQPEDFAHSIVFDGSEVWVMEDGTELDIGDNWEEIPEGAKYDLPVIRPSVLYASDFVAEPAANRSGLFSEFSVDWKLAGDDVAAKYSQIVDDFINESGFSLEHAYAFCMRYFYSKNIGAKENMNIKKMLGFVEEEDVETAVVDAVEVDAVEEEETAVGDEIVTEDVAEEIEEEEVEEVEEVEAVEVDETEYLSVADFEETLNEFAAVLVSRFDALSAQINLNSDLTASKVEELESDLSEANERLAAMDKKKLLKRAKPGSGAISIVDGIAPSTDDSVDGRSKLAQSKPKEVQPESSVNGRKYPKIR